MHYFRFGSVALVALAVCGYLAAAEVHQHEALKAPHGGNMLVVGEEIAHVEIVHDDAAGKMTLYIYDKDATSPLALKDAPRINLRTADGNKQLVTSPIEPQDGMASRFEVTDEALKSEHMNGRIALDVGGKKYSVPLDDGHGH